VFVPDKFLCKPNICKHDQEPSGVSVNFTNIRSLKNLPWAYFFEAAISLVTITPSPSVNVSHKTFIFVTDADARGAKISYVPGKFFVGKIGLDLTRER
jgi:hypothetical protein